MFRVLGIHNFEGRKNFENVWGFGLQQQKNGQTFVSFHLLSILSKLKPNLFTKILSTYSSFASWHLDYFEYKFIQNKTFEKSTKGLFIEKVTKNNSVLLLRLVTMFMEKLGLKLNLPFFQRKIVNLISQKRGKKHKISIVDSLN